MAKLNWGAIGERIYGTGVDRGVFYPSVGPGVAWNGLIAVKEIPEAPDSTKQYFDGSPYRSPRGIGEFTAQIEAYTYPDEFEEYEGWAGIETPRRNSFGMSYRTFISDDVQEYRGYFIHLIYNATALPSAKSYDTLDDEGDPSTFEWELSTKPVHIPGYAPASHLIVDSTKTHSWALEAFEAVLYGGLDSDPYLPTVDEVVELFDVNSYIRIVDHGDGTWTATGPDDLVKMVDATTFEITTPNVVYLSDDTYQISSY